MKLKRLSVTSDLVNARTATGPLAKLLPAGAFMDAACCYLGRQTILANRAWIDTAAFREFRIVDVAPDEPWAANVLVIGETVVIPSSFPATARMLAKLGWNVRPVDVSELMKAEAGVTCMSLIFETFLSS